MTAPKVGTVTMYEATIDVTFPYEPVEIVWTRYFASKANAEAALRAEMAKIAPLTEWEEDMHLRDEADHRAYVVQHRTVD